MCRGPTPASAVMKKWRAANVPAFSPMLNPAGSVPGPSASRVSVRNSARAVAIVGQVSSPRRCRRRGPRRPRATHRRCRLRPPQRRSAPSAGGPRARALSSRPPPRRVRVRRVRTAVPGRRPAPIPEFRAITVHAPAFRSSTTRATRLRRCVSGWSRSGMSLCASSSMRIARGSAASAGSPGRPSGRPTCPDPPGSSRPTMTCRSAIPLTSSSSWNAGRVPPTRRLRRKRGPVASPGRVAAHVEHATSRSCLRASATELRVPSAARTRGAEIGLELQAPGLRACRGSAAAWRTTSVSASGGGSAIRRGAAAERNAGSCRIGRVHGDDRRREIRARANWPQAAGDGEIGPLCAAEWSRARRPPFPAERGRGSRRAGSRRRAA